MLWKSVWFRRVICSWFTSAFHRNQRQQTEWKSPSINFQVCTDREVAKIEAKYTNMENEKLSQNLSFSLNCRGKINPQAECEVNHNTEKHWNTPGLFNGNHVLSVTHLGLPASFSSIVPESSHALEIPAWICHLESNKQTKKPITGYGE